MHCSGSEWDYVVLSTVRSMPVELIEEQKPKQRSDRARTLCNKTLGIITDKHQINVAITRAKKGLVIIGWCNFLLSHLLYDYTAWSFIVIMLPAYVQ